MTSSTRRETTRNLRPPTPHKQPDQDDEEAAARGTICVSPMSSKRDSQPPAPRSTFRPAEAFQPNSPSCGNQPANISLTAPSSTDTHANSSTLVRPPEAAPAKPSGRRFTMPP